MCLQRKRKNHFYELNTMKHNWEYKKLKEVCQKGSSNIQQNKIAEITGNYPVYGASGFVQNVDFYHQEKPYIGIVKDGSGVGRVNIYPAQTSLLGTMQYILPNDKVLLGYLAYCLQSLELSKFASGAAIPHIYFRDYGESPIPLPPLPIQQKIVAELDKVSLIIDKKKQQLKELDKLAQAIFYDMFGDPVENEKGWEVKNISDICSLIVRGPFGSALKKEFFVKPDETTYKVYEQKHAINKSVSIGEYYISKEKYNELKRFEVFPRDIIMSCSGTIGELYQIPDDAPKGIMNQALLKFTLNNMVCSRVFMFLMNDIKNNMVIHGCGLQNIGSVKEIKQIKFGLPPLSLQQSFAAKIEAIEKQKELVSRSIKEAQTLFDERMDYWFN